MNLIYFSIPNILMITYTISVHNEHEELSKLLKFLTDCIDADDKIIVQGDAGKVTKEVTSVIRTYVFNNNFEYIEFPLKNEFSAFKNNLILNCKTDYIFNIDADELPNPLLIENIKHIIIDNSEVDIFYVWL